MPSVFIPIHFLGNLYICKFYLECILKALGEPLGVEFPLVPSFVTKGLDQFLNLLSYTSVITHDIYEDQWSFLESVNTYA